jgi:integrase
MPKTVPPPTDEPEEPEELPKGISPLIRKGEQVHTPEGLPMYRVRVWDSKLNKQVERHAAGLDRAKELQGGLQSIVSRALGSANGNKMQPVRFRDACVRYLTEYKTKRDGTERPLSSVQKEITYTNCYLLPKLANAWIGELDLPDLYETIETMELKDGSRPAPATKTGAASVLRRIFAWARYRGIITANPALELTTGWGTTLRRKVLVPSIPQVVRLAEALDHFKPGLGDVAKVIAFVGPRWEEVVAILADEIDLEGQLVPIHFTASESGGTRGPREGAKTSAGVRTAVIPDIAMPSVHRLLQRGAQGRELSNGELYGRHVNGDRGGYMSYSVWSRYLRMAHAYTAAHPDGAVTYTAHELRHVCASLLIASGATDMQICNQMGHSRVETTKNIYGHLFDQDRTSLLDALNSAVTRLYITDDEDGEDDLVTA